LPPVFQLKIKTSSPEKQEKEESPTKEVPYQFAIGENPAAPDSQKEGNNDNPGSSFPAKTNQTALPSKIKTGMENLSGYSLDDVNVHYNSSKPAQLQAHAYAQGTDIHLASGQEKHLPHEAWHVVQQKQGRVRPTAQMKGKVNVNDDAGLEKEADLMGSKALQLLTSTPTSQKEAKESSSSVVQAMFRVRTGDTTLVNANNEEILGDALQAILEVQTDTVATIDSFAETVSDLADYVGANGFDATAEVALENLYEQLAEVSFKSNPILNEAWSRCIESTRSAAAKSIYSSVGGKFKKKFGEVLDEISAAYPALDPILQQILTCDVNKEHLINKGLGGLETAHKNLMDAGVGEKHTGGSGTLSKLHKELHRLKSGGKKYDYKTMDVDFERIVQDVQDGYESDDMGVLDY